MVFVQFRKKFKGYQDDLSDSERNQLVRRPVTSTIGDSCISNVRNNKPLSKYLTDRKLKISAVFIFEIKGAKEDKIFNF